MHLMYLVQYDIDHEDGFISDLKQLILAKNAPNVAFLKPKLIFRPP